MKKFIIGLLGMTLFLTVPLQTVAAVTLEPQGIKESYQTEIEGKLHTFNSVVKGSTQTITIDNGEQIDTVSFDRATEELRINNELVDIKEFKEAGPELLSEDGEFNTKSNKDYQWRLVKPIKQIQRYSCYCRSCDNNNFGITDRDRCCSWRSLDTKSNSHTRYNSNYSFRINRSKSLSLHIQNILQPEKWILEQQICLICLQRFQA